MPIYRWLRPALFALPAEAAHAMTLASLRAYGLLGAPAKPASPVRVMGLDFPNRVGLAAGFDKNGVAAAGAARLGCGFFEVGTVTLRPQRGNPKPRLFRLAEDAALVNRMGFNNAGAQALAANIRRQRLRRRGLALPVGVNIGKNRATPLTDAAAEYRACLAAVYDVADYIVVNVSSPNTPGLRALQAPAELRALIPVLDREREALASARPAAPRRPLLVKFAPELRADDLAAAAGTALAAGADGFVVANTTVARPSLRSRRAREAGGLSGPPLLPATLASVRTLRAELGPRPPVIAVGGISSAADAKALRAAGADLIQLYTALVYQGPALIRALATAAD